MEQPSTGYNFEVIGDMGKDFECPICMVLLREPVELPCAHVFCKVCLEQWQDNPMEKNAAFLCPSCKEMYQTEQVAGNKYVDKLVKTSLQVKCKENKLGCQWEGNIIDYTQHEEKCVYKTINCIFIGCEERMIVMDQTKHQIECMYRSVKCKHCLADVQYINLKNHYGYCVEYPVNCPNDGCSIIMPRKEVCNHTQNDCPYQMVNCEYISVGCQLQFRRRNKNQHQIESLAGHMNMLLNGFNMTSQELSSVKEKHHTTEQNLRNTEIRLKQTEERLQKTEKRLQITEEKLASTCQNLKETNTALNLVQEELQNTNEDVFIVDEEITKIRDHDREIDKLCFQLVKLSFVENSPFNEILKLKRFLTMKHIQELNVTIYSPNVWSDLHKMLEEKEEDVPKDYADSFIQVMDRMETNELYKINEKEVVVKVDFTTYTHLYPCFKDSSFKSIIQNDPQTIFYSEYFLLGKSRHGNNMQLIFVLPGWHNNNAKLFLLHPTENNPLELSYDWLNIEESMKTEENMILVMAVLQ